MSPQASSRLALLRFPLIVGVVFIHAYGTSLNFADGSTVGLAGEHAGADFVRNLVVQGIARIAVPLFFLMSGYLFFYGGSWSTPRYLDKLRSRAVTLLLPFLFWNLLILVLTAAAQQLPGLQSLFSSDKLPIAQYSLFDAVDAVFGITRTPIAYQFWFIRDLMLLIVLSPVLHAAITRLSWAVLVPLYLAWQFSVWPLPMPSVEGTLFFSIGAWLACQRRDLFAVDRHGRLIVLAFVPVMLLDAALTGSAAGALLHKLDVLLGVASTLVLSGYALRSPALVDRLIALSAASFFVFAVHEPLLTVLRKLAYRLLQPQSSALVLLLFFAIPLLTVLIALLLHALARAVAPRFTALISGGR